jgi:hypothetical protein
MPRNFLGAPKSLPVRSVFELIQSCIGWVLLTFLAVFFNERFAAFRKNALPITIHDIAVEMLEEIYICHSQYFSRTLKNPEYYRRTLFIRRKIFNALMWASPPKVSYVSRQGLFPSLT